MSVANTIVSLGAIRKALAGDLTLLDRTYEVGLKVIKDPVKLSGLRFLVEAITEAQDRQVLVTYRDPATCVLQSFIAEIATAEGRVQPFRPATGIPSEGLEVSFTKDDWLRWMPMFFERWGSIVRHPFLRPPTEPMPVPNRFRIAVFSDWATGMYGAPACAQSIASDHEGYDLLLHLGDVYYSGSAEEIRERLVGFWPQVPNALNRALPGNHEMYSGGRAFFEDLLPRFNQPASCFALQNDYWTFVALDTGYQDGDINTDQLEWLRTIIANAADRAIVLFSHHPPYSHFGDAQSNVSDKLREFVEGGRVIAWYWGHEHRCTLYDPHPVWGTLGRCVGSGGCPKDPDSFELSLNYINDDWRRIEAARYHNPPGALLLGGFNAYVPGAEPHAYMRLDFDGRRTGEVVRSAEGWTLWENEFQSGVGTPKRSIELPSAPAAQPATTATSSGGPPPRYVDYTFYKEDESGNRVEQLLLQMPLKMGLRYQLEVAVRVKAAGIEPEGERKPIREPRQKESVEIIVTADSEHFVIPQPVQKLILPPTGDSVEHACFGGIVPRYTTGAGPRLPLKIRLYYKRNLLEVASIEAEVVGPLDPDTSSPLGLSHPIKLSQERLEQEYQDFDLVLPREMHIDVSRGLKGIQLNFILDREKKDEIHFAGSSQIGEQDLESTLLDIRKALLGVTLWDEFASHIDCGDQERFDAAMNHLAQLGSRLWNNIFCYDINNSLFLIGEWLRNNPLPPRSTIQVSVDDSASTFVFPWNIVYDKDVPRNKTDRPDLQGFWGLRYAIEQRVPGARSQTDEPIRVEEKLEMGYLISHFNEAVEQRQFLDDLVQRSQGRISTVISIDTRDPAYAYLENCPSHIVYFFAHGHAQFPNANLYGVSVDDFVKLCDSLPTSSPARARLESTYNEIKKRLYDSDYSWIKLANGELRLNDLYGAKLQLHKRPVVFLNMCESAQVTPTGGQSFIHLFMNRGARGVLGTECAMGPFVAQQFAKEFFEGLLSGTSIGEVLLDLRQKFIQQRNPLGLAYTLYGPATTRFQPPLLPGSAMKNVAGANRES